MGIKRKNEMDKENYSKQRLLSSLNTLSEYIEELEEGDLRDKLDLHVAFIIQELNTKKSFLKLEKDEVCSYCFSTRRKIQLSDTEFKEYYEKYLTSVEWLPGSIMTEKEYTEFNFINIIK